MPTVVENLLTSIGIPAEEVNKITSVPEADQEKFDIKPFADKVKTNYQTQFKNDPTFFDDLTIEKLPEEVRKKVESNQYGRAANVLRDKLLKGLGMTEADYADLTDEQKQKFELFIPAIAEKYGKLKAGDKQVQQELIEARKQLEKYGPDYETTIEQKYESQAEKKVTQAIFNANLVGELSSIPGLKIAASDIALAAANAINSKYAFEKVGDFGIELRQKANPSMKVLKNGSSQELTLKEALTEIATERGWIEKEKEGGSGSGTVTVKPNGKGELTMVAPHVADKISNKIANEKVLS